MIGMKSSPRTKEVQINVRVRDRLAAEIDEIASSMTVPGMNVTRATVVRILAEEAIAARKSVKP